jgi:hypothetical protein
VHDEFQALLLDVGKRCPASVRAQMIRVSWSWQPVAGCAREITREQAEASVVSGKIVVA